MLLLLLLLPHLSLLFLKSRSANGGGFPVRKHLPSCLPFSGAIVAFFGLECISDADIGVCLSPSPSSSVAYLYLYFRSQSRALEAAIDGIACERAEVVNELQPLAKFRSRALKRLLASLLSHPQHSHGRSIKQAFNAHDKTLFSPFRCRDASRDVCRVSGRA